MKIILYCNSCGQSMKLNEKDYEDHIKKYHQKKVNNKEAYFNASIRRRK